MSLKLVPPPSPRVSRIKLCALVAFRAVRTVQAKVAQVPHAVNQVRKDIVVAWRESADSLPKNA